MEGMFLYFRHVSYLGNSTMTDATNSLVQVSSSLAAHAAHARGAVAAIRLSQEHHLTGTVWQADVIVASEQSLPDAEEFEVIVADGSSVTAKVAGRDPG